jgi:UDP-N-acetylmuramoyl-tripeptide--D-alanyl-D-alanine ligase
MFSLLSLIFIASFFIFVFFRLRRWLHFFQQHEYDGGRFLQWVIKNKHFDVRATFLLLILFLISFFNQNIAFCLGIIGFVVLSLMEPSPFRAKKPLVFTARAKRIFVLSLLLSIITTVLLVSKNQFYLILIVQGLPIFLVVATFLLWPQEKLVQKHYRSEAEEILKKVNPIIIGITGSYGKTTTKMILGEILNAYAPTLWTPGSINTLMGITKVIRSHLQPQHKYFVVEMGAYGIGSIRKLCQFTPPRAAIITSIGVSHFERFKDINTIARAKSEILEALPPDGIAVLNGDDLHIRRVAEKFRGKKVFFSIKDVKNIKQGQHGLEFDYCHQNKTYHIQTNLLGQHNVLNIIAAFTAAMALGVPPLLIQATLAKIKPVSHRLELIHQPNGVVIIDDAYNSNPIGFKSALEVLKNYPATRRILVTPGMVELGKKSREEHKKISEIISQVCDYVVLVGKKNTKFLQENLKDFYVFSTLAQAQEFIKGLVQPGDIVLYENDLPDIYDDKIVL